MALRVEPVRKDDVVHRQIAWRAVDDVPGTVRRLFWRDEMSVRRIPVERGEGGNPRDPQRWGVRNDDERDALVTAGQGTPGPPGIQLRGATELAHDRGVA